MGEGVLNYKPENLTKAAFAMERASAYFRELGFEVAGHDVHPSANGVDLVISRASVEFRVEVKHVGHSKGAWRSRGRHLRNGDDFIAYVFPNGRVHVEDFATHEKMRCKDGGRHLSMIAKLYAEAV